MTFIHRLLVVAALVGAGGCKKMKSSTDDAIDKLSEFEIKMCSCKDKACADKVQDEMARWGSELAKNAAKDEKPDPELVKRATDLMTRYTECMAKVLGSGFVSGTPNWSSPAMPKSPTVDTLLKAARDSAATQNKTLVLAKLDAKYVRSDGGLDPTYGSLEVAFVPARTDDPNRPIGAPVPEVTDKLTECPTWTVAKAAWTGTTNDCTPTPLGPPRCNLSQIWQRALKDEVPSAALASMTLEADASKSWGQTWTFTVVDKPRNIDIRKTYPDDCAPVVEHP